MAGSFGGHSSGRRRSLDGEMNLVPFIDLLSMCICFLLMTAIWIEVGSIQLHQLIGTESTIDAKHPLELQVTLESPTSYRVSLQQQGRVVQEFPISGANLNEAQGRMGTLMAQLQNMVLTRFPGAEISASITPSVKVNYGELVSILDILKGYGISALAVTPVRE
jgi:biopolymer transport protein TolR